MGFSDLKALYAPNESILVGDLSERAATVTLRDAFGNEYPFRREASVVLLEVSPPGTHVVEARDASGDVVDEELTTVSAGPGEVPVIGFATSFVDSSAEEIVSWLSALRCTSVQFYDWMERYVPPLPKSNSYRDPVGRTLSLPVLRRVIERVHHFGAFAQAYAPVYAADTDFARSHPDWALYRNDGTPERLGELLELMDPANPSWQAHWIATYGEARQELGFDGYHLDSYGFPRIGFDASRAARGMDGAYASFISRLRDADANALISFNQVNGVPEHFPLPSDPSYRYVEVWPPNDRFVHLEGLMSRSAIEPSRHGIYAIYPPVWGRDRTGGLVTVLHTMAVTTMLGGGALVLGDRYGALRDPYYPRFETLEPDEIARVLAWHRFGLRCRDLFLSGADQSWIEIGDENGAVALQAAPTAELRPEPAAGTLFARVVRDEETVTIGCLDLTASEASWRKPSALSTPRTVVASVLVPDPGAVTVDVAVLGARDGRFSRVAHRVRSHREGLAVEFDLRVKSGWSVARIRTREAPRAGARRGKRTPA